jgi:glycosyltransferase involved in cell wall biosynthesis
MNNKMKIAVLSPNYSFLTGNRTMHQWAEVFINKYADKIVTYEEAKEYKGDAIVCFNGRPDLPKNCPPKEFKGLKLLHLMDHVFQVENTNKALKENEIDYLMCYNRHDLYDPFFQHAYPEYVGKVIPVPFGYNETRFKVQKTFLERKNKCVALGAVNPVSDPLCIADIRVYATFNANEQFTHKWRRALYENRMQLVNEIDSLLPAYPKTKDFNYDIVETYNNYRMFTSGESIMNYPSVKTFEGMACGSVLVCSDHQCYKDLGLVDGLNCIMHKQNSIKSFQEVVQYYRDSKEELELIARAGQKHVEKNFNPNIIAKNLFNNIKKVWKK